MLQQMRHCFRRFSIYAGLFLAAVVTCVASVAAAAPPSSGPPPFSPATDIRPLHVTGPHAPNAHSLAELHGSRPLVAIWTRLHGLSDAARVAAALDRILGALPEHQAAVGYVIFLPDPETSLTDAGSLLVERFAATSLEHVALAVADHANDGQAIAANRISDDPTVLSTTFFCVNQIVTRAMANLGERADIEPNLRAAIAGLVEREEAPAEIAVALCDDAEPGQRLTFFGRVLDAQGQPLARAAVVAYNTDSSGHYVPPGSTHRNPRLRAVAVTSDDGWYRFNTIKPGPYPTGDDPAHIHLTITAAAHQLRYVTFWFEGDPLITPQKRARLDDETVIVTLRPKPDGAITFRHDIRLVGD